jgi:hypothetical protein
VAHAVPKQPQQLTERQACRLATAHPACMQPAIHACDCAVKAAEHKRNTHTPKPHRCNYAVAGSHRSSPAARACTLIQQALHVLQLHHSCSAKTACQQHQHWHRTACRLRTSQRPYCAQAHAAQVVIQPKPLPRTTCLMFYAHT